MNVLKILIPFSVVAALLACSDDATSNATEDKENLSSLEGVSSADDVSSSSVSDEAVVSSSLESQLSSSSVVPDTARFDADGKIGEFTDSRDGHVYKIVKIGDQVWMAENLTYGHEEVTRCGTPATDGYDDCMAVYGERRWWYSWAEAMDSASTGCGNGPFVVDGQEFNSCPVPKPVQGICPAGWHLPSVEEYETLFDFVGGASVAGEKLKSTSGWNGVGNGTDAYGFNALPSSNNRFATSDVKNNGEVVYVELSHESRWAKLWSGDRKFFKDFSVRCVMGQGHDASDIVIPEIPKETYTGDYGTFVDSRDGRTYKTVEIGNQTWMAENLNYIYDEELSYGCTVGEGVDCNGNGLYYSYDEALDSKRTNCSVENLTGDDFYTNCGVALPMQGVCPDGWHLPSKDEWMTLVAYVTGYESGDVLHGSKDAGYLLKSSKEWPAGSAGVNAFGFSALPVEGQQDRIYADYNDSFEVCFWAGSITGYQLWLAHDFFCIDGKSTYVKTYMVDGFETAAPVRCVKGEGNIKWQKELNSSSSATISSSSVSYGQLTDERDGNVYKTVKINDRVWMAENLKYKVADGKSFCNCGDTTSCDGWGLLYTMNAAKDSSLCPVGWHVPSKTEMDKLVYEVNGFGKTDVMLRSKDGWRTVADSYLRGTDDFGFGAVPAGILWMPMDDYYEETSYCGTLPDDESEYAAFWTSDGSLMGIAVNYSSEMIKYTDPSELNEGEFAFSVRCVQNE